MQKRNPLITLQAIMFISLVYLHDRGELPLICVCRKLTRLVQHFLESRVLARFEHPVEEEAAQAKRPQHDEDGGNDLAWMVEMCVR